MRTEVTSDLAEGHDGARLPWFPILMYHRITPQRTPVDPYHLGVSIAEFAAQMRFLKEHGYQAISFKEVADSAAQGKRLGPRRVIITFDDGYKDTLCYAFPILKEYQFTATIFLVGSCLGGFNVWDRGKVEPVPLLGVRELQDMVQWGVSVGSHSLTHTSLDHLDAQDALEEIAGSKAALQQALGVEVHPFSFPHGSSNPVLREMVKEAGYLVACGIEQKTHTLFNLSRIDVAACRGSGLLWRWKLSGLYHRLRQNAALHRARTATRATRRWRPLVLAAQALSAATERKRYRSGR